jgi:Fe-S cluster assembly ATPase SufC
MLQITNLSASIDDKKILDGFNLKIKSGEVHALMVQMDRAKAL